MFWSKVLLLSAAACATAARVSDPECTPTAVIVELQPYKVICSGVTTSSTSTRTYNECETPPPGVPPPPPPPGTRIPPPSPSPPSPSPPPPKTIIPPPDTIVPPPSTSRTPSSSTPPPSSTPAPSSSTPTPSTPSDSSTPPPTSTSGVPPPPTLDCDPYGYLIQNQTLFRVDISNGDTTPVKEKVGPVGQINALGYNPVDNYLYAMARNGSGNVLLQIGADGSSKVIPSDVPDSYPEDYNNGAFTSDGHFWISSRGRMWRELDLSDPDSSNFGKSIDSGNSAQSLNATGSPATYDWVSLPTRPGQLLAIGSGDSNTTSKLLSWSTTTHEWTVVRNYGVLDGAAYIGAAYTTNGDVFYETSNQSGDVFKFDLNNLDEDPPVIAKAPPSELNDGARCQRAGEVDDS